MLGCLRKIQEKRKINKTLVYWKTTMKKVIKIKTKLMINRIRRKKKQIYQLLLMKELTAMKCTQKKEVKIGKRKEKRASLTRKNLLNKKSLNNLNKKRRLLWQKKKKKKRKSLRSTLCMYYIVKVSTFFPFLIFKIDCGVPPEYCSFV